jgi:hypothetical protein
VAGGVRGCVREAGQKKKVRRREGGCWAEKKMRSEMKVG